MAHVSRVALAFEGGVEAIFFEPGAMRPVTAIWLRRHQPTDTLGGDWAERASKMPVERRHRPQWVGYQVQVMNVENRLRKVAVVCGGDHQLGRCEPAVAVLPPDLELDDAAREGPSEHLGQPSD